MIAHNRQPEEPTADDPQARYPYPCVPLDQADVGEILGISRGRVYQIERIAKQKIRRALDAEVAAGFPSIVDSL